jgi:hypothetical protein
MRRSTPFALGKPNLCLFPTCLSPALQLFSFDFALYTLQPQPQDSISVELHLQVIEY